MECREGWDDRKAVIVKFIRADEPATAAVAAGQKGCDSGCQLYAACALLVWLH